MERWRILYFSPTIDHVGLFTQDVAAMIEAAKIVIGDWRLGIGDLRLRELFADFKRGGLLALKRERIVAGVAAIPAKLARGG